MKMLLKMMCQVSYQSCLNGVFLSPASHLVRKGVYILFPSKTGASKGIYFLAEQLSSHPPPPRRAWNLLLKAFLNAEPFSKSVHK